MVATKPLTQITDVVPSGDYRLQLAFSNGDKGEIDLSRHIQFLQGLAPLAEPAFFQRVYIDYGTICWPDNIDLDPIVIHHLTMGLPIDLVHPELATSKETSPMSHTAAAVRTAS
jgi:hypothetical protein